MPRFDGTGPLGQGPMTRRGMGFCVLRESQNKPGHIEGLTGMQGIPVVSPYSPAIYNCGFPYMPVRPWYGRGFWQFGVCRGFGRGRGRGRGRSRFGFRW